MKSDDFDGESPAAPSARAGKMLRFSAVALSIVLVAGYVLYRSGAGRAGADKGSSTAGQSAEQPPTTERRQLLPGSKSNRLDEDGASVLYADTPTTQGLDESFFFSSSKSGVVFRPSDAGSPTTSPADTSRDER